MLACRIDCYGDDCSACVHIRVVSEQKSKQVIAELSNNGAEFWDKEKLSEEVEARRRKIWLLQEEISFLGNIYFNRGKDPI